MKKLLLLALLFFILFSSPVQAQFFRMKNSEPANYAKDVPVTTDIRVIFNYRINTSMLRRDILFEGTNRNPVPTDVTFSDLEDAVYIHPKEPLKPGTYYTVNLRWITAVSGAVLAEHHSFLHFTTAGGRFHCIGYVVPSELTLAPGGFTDVIYNFIENGGGLAEVMRCKLAYEDLQGRELLSSTEEMKLIINSNQTTKLNSSIAMPRELGTALLGQTLYVRRIFEGLDHDNNRIEIRTGAKVTVGTDGLMAEKLAASVLSPEYGAIVPKNSIIPVQASVSGGPGTEIHGCWVLNGDPMGFFVQKADERGEARVTVSDRAFALKEGVNTLALQVISPDNRKSEDIEYVVSASPVVVPYPLQPKRSVVFDRTLSTAPTFRWSMAHGAVSYKIAIGKTPNPTEWHSVDSNMYTPNWVKWSDLGTGTFYWSVKAVFTGNKEGAPSEAYSFTIQ